MSEKEHIQVNVNITGEDGRMLDYMMVEDAFDNRSAFMRRLIRQEWARRYSQPNGITVTEAQAASAVCSNEQGVGHESSVGTA